MVLAHGDLEDLTLSVGPLQQAQGSGVIPEQNIRWNFVGSIFIEKNSPNRQKEDLSRPAPAWFPDYLGEERSCSAPKGLVRVNISRSRSRRQRLQVSIVLR